MTLIETFCQLYQSSMKSPAQAAKLAPRIAEIWGDMSDMDREIAASLLKLPKHSETNYEDA
jgi:hypothetical protein